MGPLVFAHACTMGLEGIVSKRRNYVTRESAVALTNAGRRWRRFQSLAQPAVDGVRNSPALTQKRAYKSPKRAAAGCADAHPCWVCCGSVRPTDCILPSTSLLRRIR
jgi:hypothetical protein